MHRMSEVPFFLIDTTGLHPEMLMACCNVLREARCGAVRYLGAKAERKGAEVLQFLKF